VFSISKHRVRRLLQRVKRKVTRISFRIRRKQILHFLHIGKTGGSAVKHVFTHHPIGRRYAIILHEHSTRLPDVPRGEKVIFFLRDPISRFVSAFQSRRREDKPRYFYPWTEGERIAFEEFDTPNQLALALSSSDGMKKERAEAAMRNISHVKVSYWNWFQNEEYLKSRLSDLYFIGFQERLVDDFEILKSRIGLPESARLPDDDVLANKNPNDEHADLDDEAVANLQAWYEDDFRLIALCRQFVKSQDLL